MYTRDERRSPERNEGIALIVTVLLLMMISAIGLAALRHAGDERFAAGVSRSQLETLYAADGAINVLVERLSNLNANSPQLLQPMDEPTFMSSKWGLPIAVRTGTADSAAPLPILKVGIAPGAGGQLNIGSGFTQSWGIYRASVVATSASGGRSQIQAQFLVPEGSPTY